MNLRETGQEIPVSVVTDCAERIKKIRENLESGELAAALGMP